eukprot:6206338-Pleurochrysis_carterae.AAC.1
MRDCNPVSSYSASPKQRFSGFGQMHTRFATSHACRASGTINDPTMLLLTKLLCHVLFKDKLNCTVEYIKGSIPKKYLNAKFVPVDISSEQSIRTGNV